jgi:hypothetical protein
VNVEERTTDATEAALADGVVEGVGVAVPVGVGVEVVEGAMELLGEADGTGGVFEAVGVGVLVELGVGAAEVLGVGVPDKLGEGAIELLGVAEVLGDANTLFAAGEDVELLCGRVPKYAPSPAISATARTQMTIARHLWLLLRCFVWSGIVAPGTTPSMVSSSERLGMLAMFQVP